MTKMTTIPIPSNGDGNSQSVSADVADRRSAVTVSIKVPSPDGTMFVHIMEDETGTPRQILVHIGKAGLSVAAWADAISRTCSMLLQSGLVGVNDLINEFSSITTDKVRLTSDGEAVHSGPEAIARALIIYRKGKFQHLKEQLGA